MKLSKCQFLYMMGYNYTDVVSIENQLGFSFSEAIEWILEKSYPGWFEKDSSLENAGDWNDLGVNNTFVRKWINSLLSDEYREKDF